MGRWVKLGTSVYLLVGLGTVLTVFLVVLLAQGSSGGVSGFDSTGGLGGVGTQSTLLGSAVVGWVLILVFSGGLAAAVGLFAGRIADGDHSPALAGAIASGSGTVVAGSLLLVIVLLLASGPASGIGQAIGPMLGSAIGAAVTGAGGGYLGHRSTTW